jgi:hypothetical protein
VLLADVINAEDKEKRTVTNGDKGRGKGINQDRNAPFKPMKMSYADRGDGNIEQKIGVASATQTGHRQGRQKSNLYMNW